MNRDIPGYYYDEEKKRYFKIQPNHTIPAGSAHSADQVKRRKLERETASENAKDAKRQKDLVRRAEILKDPLLGGSVCREIGHRLNSNDSARAFVNSWESAEILPSEANPDPHVPNRSMISSFLPSQGRDNKHMHLNRYTVAMGAFAHDRDTCNLFFPANGHAIFRAKEVALSETDRPHSPMFRPREMLLNNHFSSINSMTIEPTKRLMLTTWQALTTQNNMHMQHNIHILKLGEDKSDDGLFNDYNYARGISLGRVGTIVRFWRATNSREPTTVWSATNGVKGSPFPFALATAHGVVAVNDYAQIHSLLPLPHEVLAVECLTQCPTAILAGTRSGSILFLDVRDRTTLVHHDAAIIKHPSSVYRIKQLSEHVIVAAGLNSTLCNYDIRFPSTSAAHSAIWPGRELTSGRGPLHLGQPVTRPLVIYPQHHNIAHLGLGFDVDADAGIVAAAQDDDNRTVSIFSTKSGRLLAPLYVNDTPAIDTYDRAEVKAVKFIPDRGDEHMKSLWVAKGTRITRFAW